MSTVGVVGAGVMGAGVAESLAEAGHAVVLIDIDPNALDHALASIRTSMRARRMFGATSLPDASEVIAKINATTDYKALADAEFVIENVTEDIALKRKVFAQMDAICRPETVFAADTSCVPIGLLASETQRPDKVLGMHFMNPVPRKDTVEVIRGESTSQETLDTALGLLESMGKKGIVVKDAPGFVSNRVLMLTVNEAVQVVQEGTSTPEDVDAIFTSCFGHPMGPLATADLIGLDTIMYSLEVLLECTGDRKFEPARLLRETVEAGNLGRKTGRGFHAYS